MDIVQIEILSWPAFIVPAIYLIMFLALALTFTGFFIKSPFIYLAVLCCVMTVLFSGTFDDYVWAQGALALWGLWAILATIIIIERRGGF